MANELRTNPRHGFPYEQLIATVIDGKMPSLTDFRAVPCEDMSCSGIAFYLAEEPKANEYVVALGKAPSMIYLCARVVQVRQVPRKGRLWHRVGCQFTGRARVEQSTLGVVRVFDVPETPMQITQRTQTEPEQTAIYADSNHEEAFAMPAACD
ncbi:MAG: hypothetical protein RBS80_14790 [Thermoguttaceae bacterium]|jgi:hypothetical protein|nr:hypothetical protein [Thermoguttaceae bacterium]